MLAVTGYGNNSQNHLNSEDFPDPAHSIDDLNPYDYDYNHEHDPKLPKPPRSRKGRIADPTKSCHLCQTSKTSLWRKADIEGENVTVCNACGIKWKTNAQKQVQIAAAVAQGLPIPVFADDVPRVAGAGARMMQTMGSMGGVGGVGGVTMQSGWELGLQGLQGLQGVESVTGQVFAVGGGGMVQIIPPGTQILPNGVPSRIICQPASMPEQIPQQITPAPTQPPIVNQQIPPPDTQPLNPNAVPVTAPTAPLKTIEAPPMARLASLAPLYPSTQRGPVPPSPCQPGQPRLPPSEPVLSVLDVKPVATVAKPTEPKGPKDAILVSVLPAESSDSGVQVTEPAPAAEVFLKD
ncbi:Similar to GATA zinc finger domain-containing protein 16; acc. no. B0G188 [Pyronema omphalodes CBS 100304]|uniref:Similar to GATA zinc finger domain-containing protein 16 acc. no. B0G188 n=1 Tax=Pyronema omphalodes (strain CBS 100304) TaxID=1076935 RepID=U4LHI6_PYROM|nr:Similar to GATA zinc finger domain-containing protein 16; acc. no. B0G188 [Pyronema omphalodes CBS 100304]